MYSRLRNELNKEKELGIMEKVLEDKITTFKQRLSTLKQNR